MKKLVGFAIAGWLLAAVAVAATVNSGTLTVARGGMTFDPSGNLSLVLNYSNASGGQVFARMLTVPINCSSAITDQYGNVVNTTVPAGLCSSISTFISNMDSTITSAAGAGKLNP